ncbi:hypothetical protein Ae168Ps1_1556 [Pseudonocardia sp. Ae168_Ps1]|nr:hypothetical protein Ae150APs1_1551 [Pseudonocardia sp. Ae150A_Ps1]OLL79150.1 hypothetical protein Ae168Ps1_1556 [Pseudonocardia sp. Ae168_Ps1]OLL86713.1 hypothetical protein Ae263Ps1_3768c [Pseudonocardia sp. Ae263_Ps1]
MSRTTDRLRLTGRVTDLVRRLHLDLARTQGATCRAS